MGPLITSAQFSTALNKSTNFDRNYLTFLVKQVADVSTVFKGGSISIPELLNCFTQSKGLKMWDLAAGLTDFDRVSGSSVARESKIGW